jgi:hypothetical protein
MDNFWDLMQGASQGVNTAINGGTTGNDLGKSGGGYQAAVAFDPNLTVDGVDPNIANQPVTNGGGVENTTVQPGTIAISGNPGVDAHNPSMVPGGGASPAANLYGDEWWKQGRPDREGLRDASGNLDPRYTVNATMVTPEVKKMLDEIKGISTGEDFTKARRGVDDLYDLSHTKGMTSHAKYLTDNQKLEEAAAIDDLADARGGALAGAWSELAASGGADSGARERMGQNFYNNSMIEGQKIRRQGALQRGTILSDDEKMKIGIMQDLPNMYLGLDQHNTDVQKSNADIGLRKTDLYGRTASGDADRDLTAKAGNRDVLVKDVEGTNNWNLAMHQEDNKGRAAKFTADAARDMWGSGGGGGGMLDGVGGALSGAAGGVGGLLSGIGNGVNNLGKGTKKIFGG